MDKTGWILLALGVGGIAFQWLWLRKRFGINAPKAIRQEVSKPVPIRTSLIVLLALILVSATIWAGTGISQFESADDFVLLGVLATADVILIRAIVKRATARVQK